MPDLQLSWQINNKNMTYPFKSLAILLCITTLLTACKKDERTAEEWGQLAEAKLEEMRKLGENIPCEKQPDVSIQDLSTGCTVQYFPVLASDMDKFNRLRDEHQKYTEEQAKAWAKEGWVVDTYPCWMASWVTKHPLRLECKSNRVQLITTEDISMEEAKSLAEVTRKQVMDFVNLQTCTNADSWLFTALIQDKTMKIEFIPYSAKESSKEFIQKISLYNRLMMRIIDTEGSRVLSSDMPRVKGVDCVKGKPVIQLIE